MFKLVFVLWQTLNIKTLERCWRIWQLYVRKFSAKSPVYTEIADETVYSFFCRSVWLLQFSSGLFLNYIAYLPPE